MSKQSLKDKAQGKLHEVKGALTGSKGEEAKGKAQGAKGALEGKARPVRKTSTAKRP